MSHFQIFGSSVYCHVTKDVQKKLDPTVELEILVGYTDTPHNYQVYLPTSQRTVVHRDLASYFELDFSLIACMVSSMVGCVWYLDSGASFHMLGDKNIFSTLEEKDL